MPAWYNEIDGYAAQWLRNLIGAGLIAPGDVDTRSIEEVTPHDLAGYDQCHFFAGLGGWSGALRLAGWPDHRPVWTGSCPCQPFSLAGRQGGFADARHLWPFWRYLIAQCRPAIVLGEQVASAAAWLRLVRGDLEALDYAVGAIPVEAASAGADHLRDRYWFVADDGQRRRNEPQERQGQFAGRAEAVGASAVGHDTRQRRREGRPEHAIRRGRDAAAGDGRAVDMADADGAGPQGRRLLPERAGQRAAGTDGVADADSERQPQWPEPDGLAFAGRPAPRRHDIERCDRVTAAEGYMGNAASRIGRRLKQDRGRHTNPDQAARLQGAAGRTDDRACYDWVIGADGKQRRVKPGIRLLADGVPCRVAKLRALGNAIDLRPAAAFIKAATGA